MFADENIGLVAPVSQPSPLNYGEGDLQRLVIGAVPQGELPSLIESIVSNVKVDGTVEFLQAIDVQKFIDVIDMVWISLFRI